MPPKGGILKSNRPSVYLSVRQSVSPSRFIHIDSGGRVRSETSVCMKGFTVSFIYKITIYVWCVANKIRVPTTKVKVTVGVQTLSFLCYVNIEGCGRVRSETSVCLEGL
jgi:hypothetical protein